MNIRVRNPLVSRWLIVGAMLRPSWTARDPFWLMLAWVWLYQDIVGLTGGQKSSCMSTTIRAALMESLGAISDPGRGPRKKLWIDEAFRVR